MAETIEYDSLRKFIEHDILEEKIPYALRIGATSKKQKLNYMKNQGGGGDAATVANLIPPGGAGVAGVVTETVTNLASKVVDAGTGISPNPDYEPPGGYLSILKNYGSSLVGLAMGYPTVASVGSLLIVGGIAYKSSDRVKNTVSRAINWTGERLPEWAKRARPIGIDINAPNFSQEVATVTAAKGIFKVNNANMTFKEWIEQNDSIDIPTNRKDFALFYLDTNNKTRLSQFAIYSYIMQNYATNNQGDNESNLDFYNRVKTGLANDSASKKVVSENLFTTFNITSGDLFELCNGGAIVNKFNSKDTALATAIATFINEDTKMLCYNVVSTASIKKIDNNFIKSKMSTVSPSTLTGVPAQLFISDFIKGIYNESMRALLPQALNRTGLLEHFKQQIKGGKTGDNYEVDEIDTADLIKGPGSDEFRDALLEVVFSIWLQKQLMFINDDKQEEYGQLQKHLFEIILKKHQETEANKNWWSFKGGLLSSVKDDFELIKCIIKECKSSIFEAIRKTKLQETKGKFLSPKMKELETVADYKIGNNMGVIIDEISELVNASTGTLCKFESNVIAQLKKNDVNMNFSTCGLKGNTFIINTNSLIESAATVVADQKEKADDIEKDKEEEVKASGVHIATCVIISTIVVCGFFYHMYSDDESKLTVTNGLIASVVAILGAYGLFETGLLMSALKSFFGLFGISTDLFGGSASSASTVSANPLSALWNQVTSSVGSAVGSAVASAANSSLINMIQTQFPSVNKNTILGIVGAVSFATAIGGFMALRSLLTSSVSSNPSQNLAQLQELVRSGKKFSLEAAQFSFNPSTGAITTVYRPRSKNYILISLGSHFGINEIYMVIEPNGSISYEVGDLKVDSKSYIENKPVETALVLAYLVKDKHFSKLSSHSSSGSGESSDYVFNFEDDGSLVLSKKDSQGKLVQIESVSSVIKQQMANDSNAAANKTKVCKDLFGAENESCNKHFYSILGRAGLNMLANIGEAASKSAIISKLNSAEVNIKYEILKNLDWKMKISNGNKAMVSVSEWVQRLKDDKRSNVKELGNKYEAYLNSKSDVKQLLENMVNHINTNSRLLAEKYKEAVEQPASSGKRRRRLTSEQVANLRSQVITENSLLNSPFPFPGRPGTFLYPINQNGGYQGNFTNNYKQSFSMIKQSLAGFKQKLSTATEKKLEEKIQKIEKLETELFDIHKKINTYTQILRSDKNSRFHKKDVRIEDIEDLINQYTESTKKQTKHIATVTTAFGKIKMLLESQDGNDVQRENYYNL